MKTKIITLARLIPVLKHLTFEKIVFTNGCFDLLHYGHIKYLQKARSQGDILIVGLNSDESVKRLKGRKRPITPQKDRAHILAALECVDYVVIFREDTPLKLIKALHPDILVKGADWSKDEIVGASVVKASGGKVITIPFVKDRSTTKILKKILKPH